MQRGRTITKPVACRLGLGLHCCYCTVPPMKARPVLRFVTACTRVASSVHFFRAKYKLYMLRGPRVHHCGGSCTLACTHRTDSPTCTPPSPIVWTGNARGCFDQTESVRILSVKGPNYKIRRSVHFCDCRLALSRIALLFYLAQGYQ